MAKQPSGRRKKVGGFLPEGASALMTRWLIQAGGLTVVSLALALTAALLTYDHADRSWNTAANPDGAVTNMLGGLGATLSDLLLQLLGLAAWLPALALAIWGGRLMVTGRPLERVWLRVLLLLSGLLLVAIGLAEIPIPPSLHLPGSLRVLGGSAGKLLLTGLVDAATLAGAAHLFGSAGVSWVLALICAGLGTMCSIHAMGLSWAEWRAVAQTVRRTGNHLNQAGERLRDLSATLGERLPVLGRRGDADDDEPLIDTPPVSRRLAATLKGARREPSLNASSAKDDDADPLVEPSQAPAIERAAAVDRPEPLVAPRLSRTQPGRREKASRQGTLDLPAEGIYEVPPLTLLAAVPEGRSANVNEDGLTQNAKMLVSVLNDFGVNGQVIKVRPGPVVTLYELEPAPGTKTSRVIGLADDIARSMSVLSVRIATVPGRSVIGIELPNAKRETVFLRELLASEAFERAPSPLTLVLGKDIGGQPVMVDLARMPHLLIAGTTGSGKSVAINTMILSLLYRLTPEECRVIMIDPKMLELSVYDGIPHLLAPVVTEPGKAVVALKWAVREMEDRYRAMSQLGVRNIAGYNQRLSEAADKGEALSRTVQTGFDNESGKPIYEDQTLALEPLPFIVIIVDEMADLMLVAGKEVEGAVQRLAQMARAAGIHIIMATQRPSVDVITGTIKANFPSRISFQVTSKIDSRTILGEQGAEQLLGQGDMLYMASGGRITRVHGPFVSDKEVEAVVEHLRSQGEPHYVESVTADEPDDADLSSGGNRGESGDGLYDQAVALVAREGKASTSFVQRHLQIGYNRAARIIEKMEQEGVISKANHVGKREVLVRSHDD
ncbi:MAG TPA: DNA translocase FtsK 4TM domain-containing protein [Patescibacteria group bacterium]|nr:DNA translocase FtsK 4TM domain-containing protein [Patescibacteria group bacterium]